MGRLWRINIDAVEVYDADGKPLAVTKSIGVLDGPLRVHVVTGVEAQDQPGSLEPYLLTNDQAAAIQRHLDAHGEDVIVYALRKEHEFLLNAYNEERAKGLSQQAAHDAARKRLEAE